MGIGFMAGPSEDEGEDPEAALVREQRQALQQLSPDEIIRKAHRALLEDLTAKAMTGSISHQEMAILRNMLRDNGMILGVAPIDLKPGAPAPIPLPSFDDDDEYEHK